MTHTHDQVYTRAELYDVAFSYRDFEAEAAFYIATATDASGRAPTHTLELAAGPGRHSLAFARRGLVAHALDRSEAMCAHNARLARAEGLEVVYRVADMRTFDVEARFDLIVVPLDSGSYLLTDEDAAACWRAMAAHLRPGGVAVLDLCHPRALEPDPDATSPKWEQRANGLWVETTWGQPGDAPDPETQVGDVHVQLRYRRGDGPIACLREVARQRVFTTHALKTLTEAAEGLEVAAWYGALDTRVAFGPESPRMVVVLRRC